ncbi:MAG: hypothetical protein B7X99_04340 [Rhizobiales bacterium 17-65-6]|nr:MAG: hypothetical protein B7Z30_08550 [Rhizobiales bacterium 12-68-15]OYX86542.1 MAG: hypothetical protein B7Y84_13950 [Azorhizobium sp. 32-67-21]OZA00360.1 MAG: hypothetical protein B7X99_04340 [Rhizobiales bacterium 17-65-6]
MDALSLEQVYALLAPGPVVFLTTCRDARAHLMVLNWHMMVDVAPPYIACVVPQGDPSFSALRSTRDCVIAVPSADLSQTVAALARGVPPGGDPFAAASLTPAAAESVTSPLVTECFVNLECRVTDTRLVSQYNLFILEVMKAWHDPAQGWPATIRPRLAAPAPAAGNSATASSAP